MVSVSLGTKSWAAVRVSRPAFSVALGVVSSVALAACSLVAPDDFTYGLDAGMDAPLERDAGGVDAGADAPSTTDTPPASLDADAASTDAWRDPMADDAALDAEATVDALAADAWAECTDATDCPSRPGSVASCDASRCVYACAPGFESCDGDSRDGCEIDTDTDLAHCGGCGRFCGASGARGSCAGGVCSLTCEDDRGNCDTTSSDCETPLGTMTNCAACGNGCGALEACDTTGATNVCSSTCGSPAMICGGACVDTTSSRSHCGGCDRECPDRPLATERCTSSLCELDCIVGYDDCDGAEDNGCEAPLASSLLHCGMCGRACALPNAAETCTSGECALGACDPSFADCNSVPSDGCERDLRSDSNHCGACGRVCPGSTACVAGVCNPVIDVSTGLNHACALRQSGTALCWGLNEASMLGDGTTFDRGLPTPVSGAGRYSQISVGDNATCAIERVSERVHCWGRNQEGELGDGSPGGNRGTPAPIQPRPSDAAAFAGRRFLEVRSHAVGACARDHMGEVWCWGRGGRTGDGTTAATPAAVRLSAPNNVVELHAGNSFVCARTSGAEIWCWGTNEFGQLGDGTTMNRLSPVRASVPAAERITGGSYFACALSSREVYCWGNNDAGQLGVGFGPHRPTPTSSSGLTADELVCGQRLCFARETGGDWQSWGNGAEGQLGDGGSVPRGTAGPAALVPRTMRPSFGFGSFTVCGIDRGRLSCWGGDYNGTLGLRSEITAPAPVSSTVPLDNLTALGAGIYGTCVVRSGVASCSGLFYVLGASATPYSSSRMRPVPTLPSGMIDVDSGHYTTCAASGSGSTGTVHCWGTGLVIDTLTPTPFAITGGAPTQLTVGANQVCALVLESDGDRVPYCMGSDASGGLGRGTMSGTISATLMPTTSTATDFEEVEAGLAHVCARRETGQVVCWGRGAEGQIGDGTTSNRASPTPVMGLTDAIDVATGERHSCAVRTGGSVVCWGANAAGQLGDGTTLARSAPTPVAGITGATAVGAGVYVSCAVLGDGTVSCWGTNVDGERGTGDRSSIDPAPTLVPGVTNAVSVTGSPLAQGHMCAVLSDGTARCWGLETMGRSAVGHAMNVLSPTLLPISY